MTKKFMSYDKPRLEIAKIAKANPLFHRMMSINDIDGVINSTKNLAFYDLALTAYVVLQPLCVSNEWLTGRFAQLFANVGIPRLLELGWNFDAYCGYVAEMGGVTIRPMNRISKQERELIAKIILDLDRQFIGDEKQWGAIANAPLVGAKEREIVYSAFLKVLWRFASTGDLVEFGIPKDADVNEWGARIYDPELENFFKATLTTSMVAAEWKDTARKVHDVIGHAVATEINRDLKGFNSGTDVKLTAVCHLDCVEVLFDGIAKLPTTINMINDFEASSGIEIATVMTKGDAYKDVHMAQAAKQLNKLAIHLHFGKAADFMEDLRADVKKGITPPDYTVLFPAYDFMWEYNPGLASVNTAATTLWSFIEVLCKNPNIDNWDDLLGKINNAVVITGASL